MEKTIKIKFVDFWEHWDQNNNFLVNILNKYFKVEFSENPDYVFFSNFSKRLDHMKYKDAVKIFYTQENICPDFNFCDYGIGFEYLSFGDRYLQFPLCYINERYGKDWIRMSRKHFMSEAESEQLLNRGFCSFVVSNKYADSIRDEVFDKLTEYKEVASGGRYKNNIGFPKGVPDKFEFVSKYKFSLCFENSSHPGYYTEKLIEGFGGKTVPIYWGDPRITDIFNTKSFINLNDCKDVNEMISRIIEIDSDPEKYKAMLKEPALRLESASIWQKKQEELENFLLDIFKPDKKDAFRRNRVFWGERYCKLYEKMRNWYVLFFQNKLEVKIITFFKRLKKEINK